MRNNRAALTVLALLLLMGEPQLSHAQAMSPAWFRAKGWHAWEHNIIVAGARPGELVLMGEITPAMATDLRKELANNPGIDTIVIDSQGGIVTAALDMADIVRTHQLRLVVDGRCFSACAHYLFPAALRKTVLPGSLVGIHGSTYYDRQGGVDKEIPIEEAREMLRSSGRLDESRKLEQKIAQEARFYRDLKINVSNHTVFQHYLQHRKLALAGQTEGQLSSTESCPFVWMWVLDRAQLEAMGVRGIEQFWFPEDSKAQQRVLRDLGMTQHFIHFGSATGLEAYCAPSLRARVARWFASFRAGK